MRRCRRTPTWRMPHLPDVIRPIAFTAADEGTSSKRLRERDRPAAPVEAVFEADEVKTIPDCVH